jgi:hypothetical protein
LSRTCESFVNELLSLIPYKLIVAAYNFLPPLIVLSRGEGAVGVGIVSAVYMFGLFFGPLLWTKFASHANRKYLVMVGYIGLLLGLLMLTLPSMLYPGVFVTAFFPQASYFAVLAEVKRKKGSLGESLGKLEQLSGIAWAVGLLIGFAGVSFLTIPQFIILLAAMTLVSLPLVTMAVGSSMTSAFVNGFKELGKFNMWVLSSLGVTRVAVPQFKRDRRALSLYLFAIVFAVSSGFTFPQMATFLEDFFAAPNLIYLCYFIDACASTALFSVAGRARHRAYQFGYPLRILAYVALLASTYFVNLPLFLLFYLVEGLAWGFIMIFFEYSGLKLGEGVYGTQLSLRLFTYSVTSALSGFIIDSFGFLVPFVAGLLLFCSTWLFYGWFKKEIEGASQSGGQPIPRTSSEADRAVSKRAPTRNAT